MSLAEDYMGEYRVKFVDIRINPPGGRRRQRAGVRACQHRGCDAEGDCRAPKPGVAQRDAPAEDDHYWFCRRHAADYNRSYDFFEGMTETEIAAFHASAAYGHKRTWRFGGGPVGGARAASAFNRRRRARSWLDDEAVAAPEPEAARGRTRLQKRALDELDLAHDATAAAVRERYALLVKRFHPDSNGGDRSMEGQLTRVIRAFKALKAAGLA